MCALRQELFAPSRSWQMECFIMRRPMRALAGSSLVCGARAFGSSAKTVLAHEEEAAQEHPEPKPFTSIPRHKGLPLIGSSWEYLLKFKNKRHLVPGHREKVYGKIFLERMSPVFPDFLTVMDSKDIETVLRADGKTPIRPGIPAVEDLRMAAGLELGVLFSQGEEWLAQRQPMSKYLLVPKGVNQYSKDFNAIARDLVERVRKEAAGENGELVDSEGLLFKWSFESVHQFILSKRCGLLGDHPPPESLQLIRDVEMMFKLLAKFLFAPPLYKLYPTKNWKRLLRTQEGIVRELTKSIEQRMKEIDAMAVEDLESLEQFDFLTYMLTKSGMTMKTLLLNTMDLLQGGIDTTSHSLLFTLYCLATNPEVQHQLRRDIQNVIGESADITIAHIHELPLLRNCIKEAQRLYPIGPFTVRTLNEDVVLSGYKVPAGTFVIIPVYQTARSADYFKNPDEYNPDRWKGEESKQNQFAFLPFGFGPRMCIGRRVAELEMRTTLAHLVRQFDIKYLDHEPMETVVHILMSPSKPVRLGLTDHTQ